MNSTSPSPIVRTAVKANYLAHRNRPFLQSLNRRGAGMLTAEHYPVAVIAVDGDKPWSRLVNLGTALYSTHGFPYGTKTTSWQVNKPHKADVVLAHLQCELETGLNRNCVLARVPLPENSTFTISGVTFKRTSLNSWVFRHNGAQWHIDASAEGIHLRTTDGKLYHHRAPAARTTHLAWLKALLLAWEDTHQRYPETTGPHPLVSTNDIA